ncbi:MAG: hypothetical protein J6333_10710 [Planctomycetes bacterium]|nr:hypothetical protein [Planctomycetota bacterium]
MKALRIAWRVVKWAAFLFVAANLAYACSPQVNVFVNGIIENWNLDAAALGIPGIQDARMDVANYGLSHGSNDPGRVVFIHGKMTEGQFRAYVQSLAGVVDTSEQNIVCSFKWNPYVGERWQEFFRPRFPPRGGPVYALRTDAYAYRVFTYFDGEIFVQEFDGLAPKVIDEYFRPRPPPATDGGCD